MTKPNLFSALNAAIEHRSDLMTIRNEIAGALGVASERFDEMRMRLDTQHKQNLTALSSMESEAKRRIEIALANLDAVIGEDPAEKKEAA